MLVCVRGTRITPRPIRQQIINLSESGLLNEGLIVGPDREREREREMKILNTLLEITLSSFLILNHNNFLHFLNILSYFRECVCLTNCSVNYVCMLF